MGDDVDGTRTFDARALLWPRSDSLREANRRKIIRAVMVKPGTQTHIARYTELSQATISTVVAELHQEGIFHVHSGDGERGKQVRLGPVRGVAVGVEVNHSSVTVAVRRVDTTSTHFGTVEFGADQAASLWVRHAVHLIEDLLAQTGLSAEHIVSIGLGVPASIDPWTGDVTQASSSLGWDLSGNLGDRLRQYFPQVPVIVDNEANFGAFGEHLYGAGSDHETMLYVKASVGIGAGLINTGQIYRGRHGVAGEIGHMTMDPDGTVCRCGSRGCLETVAGGVRLLDQVRQAYLGYRIDLPTSLEGVIERAKGGDPVCRRVLEDAGRNLGLALAKACNLVDPEIVVLGGELGRAADLLLEVIENVMHTYALRGMFDPRVAPTRVVGSALGPSAGSRGALGFALGIDYTAPT